MKKFLWSIVMMFAIAAFAAPQEKVFWAWQPNSPNYKVTQQKDGSFRAECLVNEKKSVGVKGYHVNVVPGQKWVISFQLRGNVRTVVATAYSGKNEILKLSHKLQSAEQWQNCSAELTIPDGSKSIYFRIFAWAERGWFELRNFSMVSASSAQTAK